MRGEKDRSERIRLLLVEDEETNRMTFAPLLEDAGYSVIEASSVAEARTQLAGGTFDVVVLDLNLGDGLGSVLVPDVRRGSPAAVIALLTGATAPPIAGIDVVLAKGAHPAAHLRALQTARQRDLRPAAAERAPTRHDSDAPSRPRVLRIADGGDRLLATVLRESCDVTLAASVAQAEKHLRLAKFDVILADQHVSGGGAIELLRTIDQRAPATIGVLLIERSDDPDLAAARAEGSIRLIRRDSAPETVRQRVVHAAHVAALRRVTRRLGAELSRDAPRPPSGVRRALPPQPPSPAGAAPHPHLSTSARGRVLVVDDEPASRLTLAALLSIEFEVESASSVAEAEAVLARTAFDVVLTDYEMPGEPGTVLLSRLRSRPGVVGMLITGHAEFEDVHQAREDPDVYRVLLKPYQPDMLLHRVRMAVRLAQGRVTPRP